MSAAEENRERDLIALKLGCIVIAHGYSVADLVDMCETLDVDPNRLVLCTHAASGCAAVLLTPVL
jgi:hypothetical protein